MPVHRVAFKIMRGRDPVGVIDHKNGVKHDNRWENLREATESENCHNRVGVKGWCRIPCGKYRAYIRVKGDVYDIGYYNCPTAAHFAYIKEKQKLGLLYVKL